MFQIYSTTGRLFSGSLEQLRRVKQPASLRQSNLAGYDFLSEENAEGSNTNMAGSAANPGNDGDSSQAGKAFAISRQAIEQYNRMLEENQAREAVYHAYQIMSTPVVTISSQQRWTEAYQLFAEHPYQLLPVVNEHRKLVATLSRVALYRACLDHPESHRNTALVTDLEQAQQPVIAAAPVTDVRRIATVLVEHQLEAVPIVERTAGVIGIVSRTDIMRCVAAEPPLSLWC